MGRFMTDLFNFSFALGLCIFCRKIAFPCRWEDLTQQFGRSAGSLSEIWNDVLNRLYDRWSPLVLELDADRIRLHLSTFAQAFLNKGSPLSNIWGIIDSKLMEIARSSSFFGRLT